MGKLTLDRIHFICLFGPGLDVELFVLAFPECLKFLLYIPPQSTVFCFRVTSIRVSRKECLFLGQCRFQA